MMLWTVEISPRPGTPDPIGAGVAADIRDLGVEGVERVTAAKLYYIEGELEEAEVRRIAEELLADRVIERYAINSDTQPAEDGVEVVQVVRKPGVMDPVALTTMEAISDLGLRADNVSTGRKYYIRGRVGREEVEYVSRKLLANDSVERFLIGRGSAYEPVREISYGFRRVEVELLDANDDELMRVSREMVLSLNLDEMRTIREYFSKLGREPTDVELESLAQTWSEHCVHKTFKGIIEYDGKVVDNLLKSTVMRATEELAKPWCVSVFEDNAGVIRFDDEYDVCFKVETHNHPSAIEPYGGAETGIGGVIRDPMGTGLGAKPVLSTDVFCFAPPDFPHEKLPKGVLHPKRVFKGVVAGVRDYGNRMGIPTANGALFFDERYLGNPLVYCGNAGLIPHDKVSKKVKPGDLVVVVGGRTGRDGIHGATFSSVELTEESEVVSSGAVQIGNAITEKKMVDVLLQARDEELYDAITDCGGGGLSSAVGEMGRDVGVEVNLEKVKLKYEGLSYTEIWVSEAQERMLLAVPPQRLKRIMEVFSGEDVEATVIGKFTGDRKLRLFYEGKVVCELEMGFLHKGYPRPERKALWKRKKFPEPRIEPKDDYGDELKRVLGALNVCSKEWVIRQYDHEVQGGSVLKPLVGAANDGPGDACIAAPRLGSRKGIIVSNGMKPRYGDIDAYAMGASAIDEALRQIIAVGGSLNEVGLLDNFCWGNTDDPEQLGSLVRAAFACYDVAKAYGTPFISGKDSLNNEFATEGRSISVPPSLLISAMAVMEDVAKAVSMDLKEPGNAVYVVGMTKDELGGSEYYAVHGAIGNDVPQVNVELGKAVMEALSRATGAGCVRACHDCSEGGIAVAAAEMAFAGDRGMRLDVRKVPRELKRERDDVVLFSESNSRFVVEVEREKKGEFERILAGVPFAEAGEVSEEPKFEVVGLSGDVVIDEPIAELKEAWQATLRW